MLRQVCKMFDVKTDKFQGQIGLCSVNGLSDRLKVTMTFNPTIFQAKGLVKTF